MSKLGALVGLAAIASLASTAGSAMPVSAHAVIKADGSAETVRLVCDEFGRCWQTESAYPYVPRGSSRDYRYDPYSDYGYGPRSRPLSKWEQKGFCPPGQRKKGNC